MNIFLTKKCTNYCPYCFAQEKMTDSSVNNFMSLPTFKYILDFICKSKVKRLNLMGGEPFIHPNIEEMIMMVNEIEAIKNVTIFSGGIISSKKIEELTKHLTPEKYFFVFNLNNKEDYRDNHHSQVLSNIKRLREFGLEITLSYNIYKESFNYQEIFNICDQLRIHKIRWSLAYPGIKKETKFIPFTRYSAIRDRIYRFIMEAYEKNFELTLDCQLPLCFFSEKQVLKIQFFYPQFIEKLGRCSPAIDVGSNLEVWRCFALYNDVKTNLKNFNNINEIYQFFKIKTDSCLYLESSKYCVNCEYWKDKLCQAGCLSFNVNLINNSRQRKEEYEKLINAHGTIDISTKEQILQHLQDWIEDTNLLLKTLYFLVEREEYDIIKNFYDRHKLKLHRLRNLVIFYLISIAFVNKKDKEDAVGVISEGLKMSKSSELKQKFEELLCEVRNEFKSSQVSYPVFSKISNIQ